MYDSRTDKARTPKSGRARAKVQQRRDGQAYDALTFKQRIGDVIAEHLLDDDEPAMVRDCESVEFSAREINALHAEALKMHEQWFEDQMDEVDMERDYELAPWEAELLLGGVEAGVTVAYTSEAVALSDEIFVARMRLEAEHARRREAQYDHAYGGYSNDTYTEDMETVVDCWLPYMRMDEVRETFGENWLGNGFHVISPNAIRRTK